MISNNNGKSLKNYMINQSLFKQHNPNHISPTTINKTSPYTSYQHYFSHHQPSNIPPPSNNPPQSNTPPSSNTPPPSNMPPPYTPTHQKQYVPLQKYEINDRQTDALEPTVKRQLFGNSQKHLSSQKGKGVQLQDNKGVELREENENIDPKGEEADDAIVRQQSYNYKSETEEIGNQRNEKGQGHQYSKNRSRTQKSSEDNPYLPSSHKKIKKDSQGKYSIMKEEAKNYKIHQLVEKKSQRQIPVEINKNTEDSYQKENEDSFKRAAESKPQQSKSDYVKKDKSILLQTPIKEQPIKSNMAQQGQIVQRQSFLHTRAEITTFLEETNIRLLQAHGKLGAFQKDIDNLIVNKIRSDYDKLKDEMMNTVERQINTIKQFQVQSFLRNKIQLVPELYEVRCNITERMAELMHNLQLIKEEAHWKKVLKGVVLTDYQQGINDIIERAKLVESYSGKNVALYFQQYSKRLNYDIFVESLKGVTKILRDDMGLLKQLKRQMMGSYKSHANYIDI